MKKLSEQIRDLVNQSSMSPHAIAKEASIEKSTMSRFMNGGTLTMQKLDQLATVLGVSVQSEVSMKKAVDRGRPRKKENQAMLTKLRTKREMKACADYFAEKANTEYISDRRGVMHLESYDLVFVYNNNPWQAGVQYRRREMKRVEERLKNLGIEILARGSSPEEEGASSVQEPYTVGLLLACGQDRQLEILDIVNEEGSRASAEVRIATQRK